VTRPSVYRLLFDPIDAARFPLLPSTGGAESLVDKSPKNLASVRVFALFNQKLERSYDLPNLS